MDNNTVQALNNIIFQIYNIEDFEEMKKEILTSLKTLIPNNCGSILMADATEKEALFCDPVCVPAKFVEMENRYVIVEKRDYGRWLMQRKKATVIRASSMLDDETREKTELYRSCFAPFGVHHLVNVTIVHNGQLLGLMALYRLKSEQDFTDREIFMLETLSDHLNVRFHAELNKSRIPAGAGRIIDLAEKYQLTAREAEILQMILSDKSNEVISRELCISENTLKKHLQHLYRKTGASSRMRLLGLR